LKSEQVLGQQPSPLTHDEIVACEQTELQVPGLSQESTVQALVSAQAALPEQSAATQALLQQMSFPVHPASAGQFPQVSLPSTTPFPQRGPQLLSFSELHPSGQQESPPTQAVIVVLEQEAVHVPALLQTSVVQATESLQPALSLQAGVSQVAPHRIWPKGHPQSCGQLVWVSINSQLPFPQVASGTHPAVSISHVAEQFSVPPLGYPTSLQERPFRSVPSHA